MIEDTFMKDLVNMTELIDKIVEVYKDCYGDMEYAGHAVEKLMKDYGYIK